MQTMEEAFALTDERPGHHPRPSPQGFPPEEDLFYSILHPEDWPNLSRSGPLKLHHTVVS